VHICIRDIESMSVNDIFRPGPTCRMSNSQLQQQRVLATAPQGWPQQSGRLLLQLPVYMQLCNKQALSWYCQPTRLHQAAAGSVSASMRHLSR
jgi:hypothetical protein